MQVKSSFHTFLKIIKRVFLFLLIFFIFFIALFYLHQSFLIKKVEVVNKEKINLLGTTEYINKKLLLISQEDVVSTLKQKNPLIKNITVQKKLPNSLIIIPELYKPIADIIVSNGYFRISEDGRILSKLKNYDSSYPLITYYQKLNYFSYNSGDYITLKDITTSLYFLKFLQNSSLIVDGVDIKDKDMLVFNLENRKIILTNNKEINLQEYALDEILKSFRVTGKNFKVIDLRFQKPVIGF
jgi:hypothetical protein